jgi:hypothetical protein
MTANIANPHLRARRAAAAAFALIAALTLATLRPFRARPSLKLSHFIESRVNL